jgi:hypothetical protein
LFKFKTFVVMDGSFLQVVSQKQFLKDTPDQQIAPSGGGYRRLEISPVCIVSLQTGVLE